MKMVFKSTKMELNYKRSNIMSAHTSSKTINDKFKDSDISK